MRVRPSGRYIHYHLYQLTTTTTTTTHLVHKEQRFERRIRASRQGHHQSKANHLKGVLELISIVEGNLNTGVHSFFTVSFTK